MKKLLPLFAFGILSLFGFNVAKSQSLLQVIHNSADPGTAVVDIYINGVNTLDDLGFRTATGFLPVPSGIPISVGVAPGNSTDESDIIATFTVTLESGKRYVAIATGVLAINDFAPNPDNKSTGFDLYIADFLKPSAPVGNTDFIVFHGATDAPSVDVIARKVAKLVDGASYGDITDYISVPSAAYTLDVTPAGLPNTIVASYAADLSGLSGGTAVVFASGFLDPASNQNGAAFGLFVALGDGTVIQLPSVSLGDVQIIHNSPDPAAQAVDIYINGDLAIPDFAFRTATPFLELPAGVELAIGIAPGNSTSNADIIATIPVTLENGKSYSAIASGVLNPAAFSANPDGIATGFQLLLSDKAKQSADDVNSVSFNVLHGSTDAPGVDVVARGVGTLVPNAKYTDLTAYLTVPADRYIVDITLPGGAPIVASYETDLTSLKGGSATVFASGFLDPSANQNGEAFGLFAALADGSVIELPTISAARLQVVHNAADPAIEVVDVYINGSLALDDFTFRTATPYLEVPAGVELAIGVAPGNSNSSADIIATIPVTLENGKTYIAVANGVLNPANFESNPDGKNIAFQLITVANAREKSLNVDNVDFVVLHGATDAPGIDVAVQGGGVIVNDAEYGDVSDYISVPAAQYILEILLADGTPVDIGFLADLSGLAGQSALVMASGFGDPDDGQAEFGLFAVLANGDVVQLPLIGEVRVQFIHNSADPAAAVVDVYINGALALDNFAFRTATPYLTVIGGIPLEFGVAPGNSISSADIIATIPVVFDAFETYTVIAQGVLNPVNFAPNPNGKATGFELLQIAGSRENASSGNVEFRAYHGSTDAPAVDIIARNVATLVQDAAYSDVTDYIDVPASKYIIDIAPAAGSPILFSYDVDLTGLNGSSAVVFASGFLDPASNQNGEGFGLFAALVDGTVVEFGLNTSTSTLLDENSFSVFPNPATDAVNLKVNIDGMETVSITNTLGQQVKIIQLNGQNQLPINISELATGMYNIQLSGKSGLAVQQLIVK